MGGFQHLSFFLYGWLRGWGVGFEGSVGLEGSVPLPILHIWQRLYIVDIHLEPRSMAPPKTPPCLARWQATASRSARRWCKRRCTVRSNGSRCRSRVAGCSSGRAESHGVHGPLQPHRKLVEWPMLEERRVCSRNEPHGKYSPKHVEMLRSQRWWWDLIFPAIEAMMNDQFRPISTYASLRMAHLFHSMSG